MFIKKACSISPQYTFDDKLFFYGSAICNEGNKYHAIEPDLKGLITRALLRRMNKAVRMGVAAGLMTLEDLEKPDGIVLGTANGGIDDSFKFLHQILEYEEGTLTPTNFVQSTPNSVAGSLAMMTKNTGYNNTHVHYGLAFEAALLDAKMLFECGKAESLLVGAFEEISDHNFNMDLQSSWFKEELTTSDQLLNSGTDGTVKGEGSAMFIINRNPEESKAQILAMEQMNIISSSELLDSMDEMLKAQNLDYSEVTLMVGANGDQRTDNWYKYLQEEKFQDSTIYSFKNLIGEYPTATSFAVWLTTELFHRDHVPEEMIVQGTHVRPKYLLIYNHYKSRQHSLILLKNSG